MISEVVVIRGVAPQRIPPLCFDTVLLTAEDFARGGAAELYRHADGWRIVWAQPLRGDRPWSRPLDSSLLTPDVAGGG